MQPNKNWVHERYGGKGLLRVPIPETKLLKSPCRAKENSAPWDAFKQHICISLVFIILKQLVQILYRGDVTGL